jgi:hypothetical protein
MKNHASPTQLKAIKTAKIFVQIHTGWLAEEELELTVSPPAVAASAV